MRPIAHSLEENSGYSVHEMESFAGSEHQDVSTESIFQSDEGVNLVACLSQFGGTIRDSFESLDPMIMTCYLFNLSHCISKALKVLPIKHESNRKAALTRLSLFSCAKTALGTGMQILGLQPVRAM